MKQTSVLVRALCCCAIATAAGVSPEPRVFFKQRIGLTDAQIKSIEQGRAVVKILPSRSPSEVFVFGAVFINATPAEYVQFSLDIGRMRQLPSYLGVGKFSDPPTLADLKGFALEPEDIRNLRACHPGQCAVQLPADAMRRLQNSLNWADPGVAAQVNDRVRTMALDILNRYRDDGNRVLGKYSDADPPFNVDAQMHALLARSDALSVYLPELKPYLLDYPNATVADGESSFYWERVKFGLKPTLRLNHAITYQSQGPKGPAHVVMVKQLYASHYFQLALDLSACVPDKKGFYLVSLKGSTQQGLTGFKGSILRRIAVSRTRSTQAKVLASIKQALEHKP